MVEIYNSLLKSLHYSTVVFTDIFCLNMCTQIIQVIQPFYSLNDRKQDGDTTAAHIKCIIELLK